MQGPRPRPNSEEELIALQVVRSLEHVASFEQLEPNRQKTPDWRLQLGTGRTADVEVTQATDGEARSLRSQLTDSEAKAKEWTNPRLNRDWTVAITIRSPLPKALRAKDVVEAIINVLSEAERVNESPEEMAQVAQSHLSHPEEFRSSPQWRSSRHRAIRAKADWKTWLSKHSGYWLPKLLLEGGQDRYGDLGVIVLKDPSPASGPTGSVRTHFSGTEGSAGHEALITAIQDSINHKADKGQLDHSPDLKWLAVVVEGIAAWDLRDNAESNRLEPDLAADLIQVKFRCFDEVWVLTTGRKDHAVLRLSTTASPCLALVPTLHNEAQREICPP